MKGTPHFVSVICLVFTTGWAGAGDPPAADPDLAGRIVDTIRAQTARGFAGAVLVQHRGKVLVDQGAGAVKGVAMTPTTRFWVASLGKQFTSAAILKCQDKGWLTLDDPLARFFPSAPADKKDITLRQLLAHQSGLAQSYASEGTDNRAEAVARILAQPLGDRPGARLIYSNDNYQLAAAVVEIVARQEYRAFMRAELFEPAGLRDTGQAEAGHDRSIAPTVQDLPERVRKKQWGQQGYYSTTRDLLAWYTALRAGKVVSRQAVEELFKPVVPIQEGKAALGWFVGATDRGTCRIFSRGNEDFGANSLLYAYPDTDSVIIVLSHAGNRADGTSHSRALHKEIEGIVFP
jgi:CubicO group peptidase (beta-lactamase class C family)